MTPEKRHRSSSLLRESPRRVAGEENRPPSHNRCFRMLMALFFREARQGPQTRCARRTEKGVVRFSTSASANALRTAGCLFKHVFRGSGTVLFALFHEGLQRCRAVGGERQFAQRVHIGHARQRGTDIGRKAAKTNFQQIL